METLALAQAILRRLWLVVLLGVVGVGCAYAATTTLPKRYQSTLSLQLNPAAKSTFLAYSSPDTSTPSPVTALAASYSEVLKSRSFGQLVIDRLQLAVTPDALGRAIDVKLVPNTNILRLSVTWDQPDDAQQLTQQIAELFISQNVQVRQAQDRAAQLEDAARQMQSRMTLLQTQRDRLDEAVARGDLSRLTELNDLDTRLAALGSSYTNALVEIDRTRSSLDTATILDNAGAGQSVGILPLPQALVLGGVIGVMVGAGAALLVDRLVGAVHAPEDVAAVTGSAPLAAVGRIGPAKQLPGMRTDPKLVVLHAPRSASAEAFRTLRATLRLAAIEHPLRTLVVTSDGAGEGKTLVATNLAVTLAQSGQRVLLLDGDLRRPGVHRAFGIHNASGMVEALLREHERATNNGHAHGTGEAASSADAVVLPSDVDNLSILPAGPPPSNPSELLGSEIVARLLGRFAETFDIVVVDTPPVGPVADALLLAAHADAVLVVARAGRTRQNGLRGTLSALASVGKPIVGVVVNDLRPGLLSRYGPYRYYYAGYYGKHYYANDGRDDGSAPRNGHVQGPPVPGPLTPSTPHREN